MIGIWQNFAFVLIGERSVAIFGRNGPGLATDCGSGQAGCLMLSTVLPGQQIMDCGKLRRPKNGAADARNVPGRLSARLLRNLNVYQV